MKNPKKEKILGVVCIALILFIAESRSSWNVFNGEMPSNASLYTGESNAANERAGQISQGRLFIPEFIPESSVLGYPLNLAYNMPGTAREEVGIDHTGFSIANMGARGLVHNEYSPFGGQQRTEERSREQKSTAQYSIGADKPREQRNRVVMAVGEKRKASETDDSMDALALQSTQKNKKERREDALEEMADTASEEQAIESAEGDEEILVQNRQLKTAKHILEKNKKASDRMVKLWNSNRLINTRRAGYKSHHRTVYKYENGGFDASMDSEMSEIVSRAYQRRLKKDIENFCTNVAFLIEKNPLWYFIANRTTNITTKYKELLGLRNFLRVEKDGKYREMLVSLRGYYPNVFEDMLAYAEKHKPLRAIYESPSSVWNETLGDIYVQKDLEIKYSVLEDQDKICEIDDGRYTALAYALRMILALPEVNQDFSSINARFIKDTRISETSSFKNRQSHQVLLAIHTLINEAGGENEETEKEYEHIYNALENIHDKTIRKESAVSELYKDIYMVLADFYEKAKIFDDDRYVLAGKCAIKHQKYVKCEAFLRIATCDGKSRIQSCHFTHSFETNRWDISPNIGPHYHVYYVDNTTHRSRALCMPMCIDMHGKEHYLHTVSDIVKYIKILYRIEGNLNHLCPFKVNKETKKWSYIKEDARDMTMKDLANYEVVFYRIEGDLTAEKFTFAEFVPSLHYESDNISIPLFLTPLMRSAVEIGPFNMIDVHREIDSIEFVSKEPDMYEYNSDYRGEEYSNMHAYYSNLYIVSDEERKSSLDCYAMNYLVTPQESGKMHIVWYVDMANRENVYAHCLLDGTFKKKENSKKLKNFIDAVESREHSRDSKLQSIWLKGSSVADRAPKDKTEKVCIWQIGPEEGKYEVKRKKKDPEVIRRKIKKVEEKFKKAEREQAGMKELCRENGKLKKENERKIANITISKCRAKKELEILYRELHESISEKPNEQLELIVFRNVNSSKSNLGAHNEILDVFISAYNS
ncbi:hypothetical protein NEMIN01_2412 [Nematocida minor]|uniref:uncharacterized protein n=1 Tax=Nematocida minor TaxID=1912983 RepID=UPI002220F3D3|nr:uncharacterized protein NEMIN01_2412 [Nematocida minor]KAI5193207.1 hypothetical protein NEMIN01_2412 [Nematocida minor]